MLAMSIWVSFSFTQKLSLTEIKDETRAELFVAPGHIFNSALSLLLKIYPNYYTITEGEGSEQWNSTL
jgi:hypothetical protein